MGEGPGIRIGAIILGGTLSWRRDGLEALGPRLLLPLLNRPLLLHVLDWLRPAGLAQATICVNDASPALRDLVGDGSGCALDITYAVDQLPRGPAGCSRDAAAFAPADHYVVVEASTVPCVPLAPLVAAHLASRADATVVVSEAGPAPRPVGVYVFTAAALARVPATNYCDIKEMLVPLVLQQGGAVRAYVGCAGLPRIVDLASYLEAHADALRRTVASHAAPPGYAWRARVCAHRTATLAADVQCAGPVLLGPRTRVRSGAVLLGPAVVGADCELGPRAVLRRSVLWDAVALGAEARVDLSLLTGPAHLAPGQVVTGRIVRPARAGVRVG